MSHLSAVLTYPAEGRGAWPSNGAGGTLSLDGKTKGKFIRTVVNPTIGTALPIVGLAGFRANRYHTEVSVNDYAVYKACQAIQTNLGITADGLWGTLSDAALRIWQRSNGITIDGVYGPNTAKAMWNPVLKEKCGSNAMVCDMTCGHISYESGWASQAVGVKTPQDLGIGQINGPAHPTMSANDRLNPVTAIEWVVEFVQFNLNSMNGVERDAVAAYNLGVGGARSWIKAGRPDVWVRIVILADGTKKEITTKVKEYIDRVLAGC